VAADVSQVDEDFAFQGEFAGSISLGGSRNRPLGLQVRATGDGTFEAAQYLGGLPGPRRTRQFQRLVGRRSDGFVVLSGGPWAVIVHPDHCVVVDGDGKRVGQLHRVRRQSPTLGAKAPRSAIVLFDGRNTDQFTEAEMTETGLLMEGAQVKRLFQDFNLHLEFRVPYAPYARDQARGNSGVYLLGRYEVQILDSFALEPRDNGCGGLYRFRDPDVNMSYPPLEWQTYDIMFTAPRWAVDGTKLQNARVTVWHNGVKIHDDVELVNKTGAGKPEEPSLVPILLQDHGSPVRFRNIWIIDRGAQPVGQFPVRGEPPGE